jgi:hypothetical protein
MEDFIDFLGEYLLILHHIYIGGTVAKFGFGLCIGDVDIQLSLCVCVC